MRQVKVAAVLLVLVGLVAMLYFSMTTGGVSDETTFSFSKDNLELPVSRTDKSWIQTVQIRNSTSPDVIKALKQEGLQPYRTSGSELIVQDQYGHIMIPSETVLEMLNQTDLEELYHRYVENIQVICRRQFHLGNIMDGGYDVCEDDPVLLKQPCMAYSFGIRDDFSFDEQLSEAFGCEIHTFDPNNGMKDHQHSTKIYFHATGLSDKNGVILNNWRMRTLDSVRAELGHTKTNIDLIKIDIESGEWISLPEILSSKSLNGVKQLILEFHTWTHYGNVHIDGRKGDTYKHHLQILRGLYQEGFRIFFFRRFHSPSCRFRGHDGREKTGCLEVSFMRV